MNHHLDPEVVVSFISEAKGYLPEIVLGLESFAANPGHSESIKEAFRYAHIIKGAASMLGLSHISELAYQLEVTLEMVGEGQRDLSNDLLEYLCQVVSDIADLLDLALPKAEGESVTMPAQETPVALATADLADADTAALPFPIISLTPPDLHSEESGETVFLGIPTAKHDTWTTTIQPEDALTINAEEPLLETFQPAEFSVSLPETADTPTIGDLDLGDVAQELKTSFGNVPPPPQPEFDLPSELVTLPTSSQSVVPFHFQSTEEASVLELQENVTANVSFDNFADNLADDLLTDEATQPATQYEFAAPSFSVAAEPEAELLDLPDAEPEYPALLEMAGMSDKANDLLPLPELPSLSSAMETLPTDEISTADIAMPAFAQAEIVTAESAPPKETNFAAEVSDELMEIFMLEAEEHLQNMHTSLRTLEKTPDNRELIQGVRRSAHSLKGTAAMIGFRNIMQLAHRMEDLLDLIFEGDVKLTPALNRLLAESTDALEDMANGNADNSVVHKLYDEFSQVLSHTDVLENSAPEDTAIVIDTAEPALSELLLETPSLTETEYQPDYQAELELPELLFGDEQNVTATQAAVVETDTDAALEAPIESNPEVTLETTTEPAMDATIASAENSVAPPFVSEIAAPAVTAAILNFAVEQAFETKAPALVQETGAAFVETTTMPLAPISDSGDIVKSADIVQTQQTTAVAQAASQFVRVPIERLDEVVKLISEMIITRTAFEQRMGEFAHQVEELQITSSRLRRAASTLETKYEVSTLGGGRPFFNARKALPGTVTSIPTGFSNALTNKQTHGFDDLEFDRYTEFHLLSRELAEASSDIQTLGRELGHLNTDFLSYLNRQGRIYSELQDRLMRLRMVPLANLAPRLHRTVRTVSTQQNKQVEMILEGETTAIDTTALQEIVDPLLHLIRNAVDHGIEAPAERQAKGKPALGKIKLRAFYEGSQVVMQLSDDGKGLDLKKIRATAVKNGYLSATEIDSMSTPEIWSLIFTPGFSTADHVSEISGRGVGMDIVHTTIQKLKGTISLDSQFGHGTTFTIRLPLTLAVTRALMVKANGQNFAIPLDVVTQIMRVETDKIERIGKEPVIRLGGKVYPLLMLSRLLNMKSMADEIGKRPPALMLNIEGKEVVVIVDQLMGGREIVIKTLGNHLRKVHGVMGATLMGDGEVVLILNLAELLRGTIRQLARRTPTLKVEANTAQPTVVMTSTQEIIASDDDAPQKPRAEKQILTVLVVDDSPSVRRVSANLIKGAGWIPVQAKDGLDALDKLQSGETMPDLMMLDIEMPRMDGYQLLASLRALPAFRTLPIVIVSSRSSDKHRQKAFDLGATEYLVKPYQDEQVLALIRRLVKEANPAL